MPSILVVHPDRKTQRIVQEAMNRARGRVTPGRRGDCHRLTTIIATARITSFFAPYACDSCGREHSLVVDAVAG
jgi:hypothetical protein